MLPNSDGELPLPLVNGSGSREQLQALQSSLNANRGILPADSHLAIEELAFGDLVAGKRVLEKFGPFDVVLGSDITYLGPALPALMQTLRQVASKDTLVLLGHDRRRDSLFDELLTELEGSGFVVGRQLEDPSGVVVLECFMNLSKVDG